MARVRRKLFSNGYETESMTLPLVFQIFIKMALSILKTCKVSRDEYLNVLKGVGESSSWDLQQEQTQQAQLARKLLAQEKKKTKAKLSIGNGWVGMEYTPAIAILEKAYFGEGAERCVSNLKLQSL
mmetsp:Transcript_80063/g.156555  ORF Transcript_80063/g.156555 Transcript_80063/m.156555 type:complete len:126 (-) Transcript_80063:1189-1566(-)